MLPVVWPAVASLRAIALTASPWVSRAVVVAALARSDLPLVFASALTASPRASPTNDLLAFARALTRSPCESAAAAVARPSPRTADATNAIGLIARCICIEPPCAKVPQRDNAAWLGGRTPDRNVYEVVGTAASTSFRYGIASEHGTWLATKAPAQFARRTAVPTSMPPSTPCVTEARKASPAPSPLP